MCIMDILNLVFRSCPAGVSATLLIHSFIDNHSPTCSEWSKSLPCSERRIAVSQMMMCQPAICRTNACVQFHGARELAGITCCGRNSNARHLCRGQAQNSRDARGSAACGRSAAPVPFQHHTWPKIQRMIIQPCNSSLVRVHA
jgi:hypothetical protein